MKILVTGGCGFIGHNLIEKLIKETDFDIVSLDRLDTSGTLDRLAYIKEKYPDEASRISVVWHDLKSPLNKYVKKQLGEIKYIFHLAAGSHVDRSIENPMEFVMDNVVGTCNLLDYAREIKPKLFMYFSTDEVFGPAPNGVAYKEWDRYNSGNPYSASKAGAEELCLAYENTYKLPIVISHCMNVFGERQHNEKYIPLCIKRILNNEKIYVHSNKERTKAGSRFYIHHMDVSDAVLYIWKLFEKGTVKSGEKFNIVGSEEIDNFDLLMRISKILNKEPIYEMVDFHTSRPGHDLRYALDGSKMKSLGWEPKELQQRLQETVDWYLKEENSHWLK